MKSGQGLIIIGAGLLAAGLVVAGISTFAVTKQFLEGSTLIESETIEPGLAYAAEIKDLPAQRQLLLSIDVQPSGVPLEATVTEADGDTIGTYNITSTPFSSTLITREAGDHTLELKNVGSRTVTVTGVIGNSPITGEGGGVSQDDPGLQALIAFGVGIIAGIVLIIAGIVILIVGVIRYFRSRKASESMPTG